MTRGRPAPPRGPDSVTLKVTRLARPSQCHPKTQTLKKNSKKKGKRWKNWLHTLPSSRAGFRSNKISFLD